MGPQFELSNRPEIYQQYHDVIKNHPKARIMPYDWEELSNPIYWRSYDNMIQWLERRNIIPKGCVVTKGFIWTPADEIEMNPDDNPTRVGGIKDKVKKEFQAMYQNGDYEPRRHWMPGVEWVAEKSRYKLIYGHHRSFAARATNYPAILVQVIEINEMTDSDGRYWDREAIIEKLQTEENHRVRPEPRAMIDDESLTVVMEREVQREVEHMTKTNTVDVDSTVEEIIEKATEKTVDNLGLTDNDRTEEIKKTVTNNVKSRKGIRIVKTGLKSIDSTVYRKYGPTRSEQELEEYVVRIQPFADASADNFGRDMSDAAERYYETNKTFVNLVVGIYGGTGYKTENYLDMNRIRIPRMFRKWIDWILVQANWLVDIGLVNIDDNNLTRNDSNITDFIDNNIFYLAQKISCEDVNNPEECMDKVDVNGTPVALLTKKALNASFINGKKELTTRGLSW